MGTHDEAVLGLRGVHVDRGSLRFARFHVDRRKQVLPNLVATQVAHHATDDEP